MWYRNRNYVQELGFSDITGASGRRARGQGVQGPGHWLQVPERVRYADLPEERERIELGKMKHARAAQPRVHLQRRHQEGLTRQPKGQRHQSNPIEKGHPRTEYPGIVKNQGFEVNLVCMGDRVSIKPRDWLLFATPTLAH